MFEQHNQKMCKAILVGEIFTGKTCIINQFVDSKFIPTKPTIENSLSYKTLELEGGETLKLCIWDTSRQEQFRALNKIYYKDAKIVIMVYDITNRKSFDAIKEYWYEEIKNSGDEDASNFLFLFCSYWTRWK